ncbi:MAG TPA: tryptophan synthase subunit alpha [Thermomicrobiales bacterium]|nr:tryptophan synthase subunit alpha [Thermomicrobiales bacterium]
MREHGTAHREHGAAVIDGAAARTTQHSALDAAFAKAKAEQRAAIIPYVTLGWPEIGDTERVVTGMFEGGADIVEIGIPFSDPIADGPTIQRTNQRALANGVTPSLGFDVVRRLRGNGVAAPILFMGYYNPVFSFGLEKYAAACADAGVTGLLVPDLPPEESDALLDACVGNGVNLIYFLAPTSTPERIEAVVARANGFIYLIAVTGITGARDKLAAGLGDYIARVRGHTSLPLAIGFGISRREHVAQAEKLVDGVVVGAAFLDSLEGAPSDELPQRAAAFISMLRGTAA